MVAPILSGAATLVAVAASGVLLVKNYQVPKQDFAGAIALVERDRRPGDLAASVGLASEPVHAYFAPSWPTPKTGAELQALIAPGRTVWVVTAFGSNIERTDPDIAALLKARFVLAAKRTGTLGGGEVRVWRSAAK
jgi:hypothetical protein